MKIKQEELIVQGVSGKQYRLQPFFITGPHPPVEAVYLFTYSHPRGHLAGFQDNLLCVGETTNLKTTVEAPPQLDCLTHQCWNRVYALLEKDALTRQAVVKDISAGQNLPC